MKLFRSARDTDPDIRYQGNALMRMLAYMKPYWKQIAVCFLLVLVLTALELYKPILIGDAIDRYITQETAPEA